MDGIWNEIQRIANENNGLIKTSAVESAGVSRPMLRKYLEEDKLIRIRKGLYMLADDIVDDFAMIQIQYDKAIFSYGTALYLWGLSDRTPHTLDITVPQGKNISRLKRDNPDLRCHYVQPEIYELGITETTSPQGATVRLYDRERCICDLIRDKNQIDLQLYSQAIKDYFKSKPNNRKLLKYGKIFAIEDKIRTYMEVL